MVSFRKGGAQGDVGESAWERPFAEFGTQILPNNTGSDTAGPAELPAGEHTWPFSIVFPETFYDNSEEKDYILPPTYQPRMLPEYIAYKINAVVKRKGWIKSNLECVLSSSFFFFHLEAQLMFVQID